MKKTILLAAAAAFSITSLAGNLAETVKTTIGTQFNGFASGYCVPGATRPFGMVQFTTPIEHKEVGFVTNQLCSGGAHLGNFPVLPVIGAITSSPGHMGDWRHAVTSEEGHAGYYTATVDDSIKGEFAATLRTGISRFTFPDGDDLQSMIIGGGISSGEAWEGAIVVTGPRSCEGYAKGCKFCGWCETPYTVYFAAEFDRDAVETGTWKGDRLMKGGDFSDGPESGAYFTFKSDGRPLGYKFALSYVSVENAKANLKAENPGWDFDGIRKESEDEWEKYLSMIEVSPEDSDRLTQFYTHLYHVFLAPNVFNDVNGEYMGADMKIHSSDRTVYTNFSLWDTYRTQIQLLSMLVPDIASGMVESLMEYTDQAGGAFPKWVLAGIETGVMQGCPSALLIANAWAFGAGRFDLRHAGELMKKNATEPGLKCQKIEAWPCLEDYMTKGYTAPSLTLEYTSADFAISRFLDKAVNDAFSAPAFRSRADNWKNLYNPENGYIQGKDASGNWEPFSYDWSKYMEASYKEYFWMVPYDLQGLIDICGGRQAAEAKLDDLMRDIGASPFQDWYAPGNEPGFHVPWVYNWMGRPDKANAVIRQVLCTLYSTETDGLPGNDDMGTMGAWYVFTCLGMYPMVPGVGGFTLSTPVFSKATVHLPQGDMTIQGGSEDRIYTSSLKVNGKSCDIPWIDYDIWRNGVSLEYRTSSKPTSWGTGSVLPTF